MKILSWNYRGLGNPRTVRELRRLVKEKKSEVVFLMETKLNNKKLEPIRVKLGFSNVFGVDSVRKSGGLALFGKVIHVWKSKIIVEGTSTPLSVQMKEQAGE